jgi:hypothetical protein
MGRARNVSARTAWPGVRHGMGRSVVLRRTGATRESDERRGANSGDGLYDNVAFTWIVSHLGLRVDDDVDWIPSAAAVATALDVIEHLSELGYVRVGFPSWSSRRHRQAGERHGPSPTRMRSGSKLPRGPAVARPGERQCTNLPFYLRTRRHRGSRPGRHDQMQPTTAGRSRRVRATGLTPQAGRAARPHEAMLDLPGSGLSRRRRTTSR